MMGTTLARGTGLVCLLAGLLVATVPRPGQAQTQIKPYLLIVFDTSGSMSWNVSSVATNGDGSNDPWAGARRCCPGTGASRLYACKNAMFRMVSATGDVQFGLMTFPMEIRSGTSQANSYQSNQYYGNQVAGAYDYIRYRGPWNTGDCPPGGAWVNNYLKVRFDDFGGENTPAILDWMDNQEYSAAWAPTENELRADGGTPLAWTLARARDYFVTVLAADSSWSCRPYKVLILTDGIPDCGAGETQATFWSAVTALRTTTSGTRTKDVRTCVIGYSTSSGTLDGAALRGECLGGETTAFRANSEDELAVALFQIVNGTVLTETCNNLDDDCDTLIDEDNPGGGGACYTGAPATRGVGICRDGYLVCTAPPVDEFTCTGQTLPGTEDCNGLDDDCDGTADEALGTQACGTDVGECVAGTRSCIGGAWSACSGAIGPVAEACNNRDDDCDGATDEGLGTPPCGSDIGECSFGTQSCVGGVWGACTGGVLPATEVCDSLDNDCDGMTDGITRTCGSNVGVCTYGAELCTAGVWSACAGGYGGSTEVCNLFDDDCDGATDEGLLTPPCGSAVGECRQGTINCTGGTLVCTGGTGPVPETCNNHDDDCDGATDEGNPGGGASCYTGPVGTSGVGLCRPGVLQCTGGALACVGQTTPVPEACNGVDDDCDGATDEGLGTSACGTDVGECVAGTQSCTGGAWVCTGGTGPVAEACNSRDDDCDGATDEGNPGGGVPCGWNPTNPSVWDLGACDPGLTQCTGGTLVCSGMIGPTAEVCNGRDDDCDGTIDEGATAGIVCSPPPPGICTAGTPTCVGGIEVCVGEVPGTTETCNNIDDDCDGLTDEGLTLPCGTDEGACALGTQTCTAGVWGACAGSTGPTSESCNNIDDDCDGVTDGVTRTCGTGTGECSFGTETCWVGAWGPCIGGIGPHAEICNGLDDDCDDATDEENPGGGATCGGSVGECRPGNVACVGGTLVCDGGVEAVAELCDNRDNDCDGSTDEGNPGGGLPCYSGLAATRGVGVCEDGIAQCVAGAFICTGETLPATEDCNNLDDDCDGDTDEDLPTGTCGTDEGECVAGTRSCTGGVWVCTGEVGPTTEVCDLLDNDCDTSIDEANPGGGVPCGWDPDDSSVWDLGECEPGIANCVAGAIVCEGMLGPEPEECNGLDDDCNGYTDDGLSLGEPCGLDIGECAPGHLECQDGAVTCIGGVPPGIEACNCLDDDCDDLTDEDVVCSGGAVCVECNCALPCNPFDEFACPGDLCCETGVVPSDPTNSYCVRCGMACGTVTCLPCEECVDDACVPRTCPECQECFSATGACRDVCEGVTCDPLTTCMCVAGEPDCVATNCYAPGYECEAGQRCHAGICEPDPCYDVSCDPDQFCRENEAGDGECFDVCDAGMTCPEGERCFDGACADDPCYGVTCVAPLVECVNGECPGDPGGPCDGVLCPPPLVCRGGHCVEDECFYIICPDGYECEDGTCVGGGGPVDGGTDADGPDGRDGETGADGDGDAAADTPDRTNVLATGAGGCTCRTTGGGAGSGGILALFALLGLGLFSRVRSRTSRRPPAERG